MKQHLLPIAALAAGSLVALGLAAPPAVAEPPEYADHGHILVLDVVVAPGTFPPVPTSVGGCVDLANGRVLPRNAHEDQRHEGFTGGEFTARTGHIVIPTAPYADGPGSVVPWSDCADFLEHFGLG